MAVTEPFLFVILAFLVARVTRFIWLDDLIKGSRTKLKAWLQLGHIPEDVVGSPKMEEWLNEYHNNHPQRAFFRNKAYDLIDCAWCISIWVSGFTIAALYLFTDYTLPLPVFWWPALSMAAVVQLQWTDGAFNVEMTQKK